MRSILQKFFLASAVTAAAALATTNALAAVNVPFSFTANGKVCPAGYYTIGHDGTASMVTLRSGERTFAWVITPGEPAPTDDRVILRFDKEGDQYTLQSVQYENMITARLDGKKHNNEAPSRMVLTQ
ncbi:MAG TPA: hypothetical protein VHE33_17325 [Acidobacteriaceae bacterium]|nr:hypothetical protein [Acidobacteriaceae bacterium]